jgi:branched-chain amino acid transport system ATP-binding protein
MPRPWDTSMYLTACAVSVLHSVSSSISATTLSRRNQRKPEGATTMVLEPMILMFDDPIAGMSLDEVPVTLDLIARLKTDKTKTIPLIEHKTGVVRSFADRVIVLNRGELVADGELAAVVVSPVVQEAYLGMGR